jgi:hypothetical protein
MERHEESERVERKQADKLALKTIQALEDALEETKTVSLANACMSVLFQIT